MRLTIRTYDEGQRLVVAIGGEIDLQADQELEHALGEALDGTARGVDLDLSGVEFLDCSGLNALLKLRQRALDDAKSVRLRASSPAATRLLELTDILGLLGASQDDLGTGRPEPVRGWDEPPVDLDDDPRAEVVQLRRAMQTRPTIDLARGILMASFGLKAEDAWTVMVKVSQNTNIKLHRLADDLVSAIRGDPLPDPLREQVTAAVVPFTARPRAEPLDAGGDGPDRTGTPTA